jgi:hypothetical protein
MDTVIIKRRWGKVPQHVHDEIQELRTETKPSRAWTNKDTRGTTQHMMMWEANHN